MERKITKKSQYWQMVRGICILAVIMIHCPSDQNYTDLDYTVWVILRQFINFPVAMFIFLAGYFMTPEKVQGDYKTFLFKRGVRLLLPYLVWSCIYLLKTAIFDGSTLRHIIYALICGKAATPFYYIVVMLQLTIITPWLVRHRKKWVYLITPVYLVIIYTYNIVTGTVPLLYETLFPAWFFFYLFGMDCRSGNIGIGKWMKRINIYWVVIALLISIAEAFILKAVGCADGFVTSQIKCGSFLYAAALALWLWKKKNEFRRKNILSITGDYSYGIFYCHMLILWIVRKVIELVGLNNIWVLNFGLCFILTAVGSFVFVWIVRSLAHKLKCDKVLMLIGF